MIMTIERGCVLYTKRKVQITNGMIYAGKVFHTKTKNDFLEV